MIGEIHMIVKQNLRTKIVYYNDAFFAESITYGHKCFYFMKHRPFYYFLFDFSARSFLNGINMHYSKGRLNKSQKENLT
jgi:hypothetical protein